MTRLSDSRFVFVGCFVLCFGPVFAQNPDFSSNPQQLWKSFQEEMKTLEQAAHRVNKLLSSAQHLKKVDDSVAQPAENPGDVTVLGSPDVLKNGVFKMTEQPATEENDKEMNSQSGSSKSGAAEESVNHLSLGSFLNSFWSKNFPEPWWKGKNVCVKRSEKVEGNKGEKAIGKHVLVMGTGTFEHCKQTAGKYICTSVLSSPESTKTVSTTYQCCEGFKRQASGCVQGEEISTAVVEPEYLHKNDASIESEFNSINVGASVEEKSFSSQSDEGHDGQPRWLENYFKRWWMKK